MDLSVGGVRVPFKPRQFPARLSKRIGLRTMASIGAKTPCPRGEQIVNGGFETGDFTGWTRDELNTEIWSEAHSGSYACWIRYDPCTLLSGWIAQDLNTLMPVECVKSFTLWATGWCSGYNSTVILTVTYDDDSTTTHTFSVGYYYDVGFQQCIITGLSKGKKIKSIKIEADVCDISVDDVSLLGP